MAFDPYPVRSEFPALARTHLGRPVVYLDNACTTAKPLRVIEAMRRYDTDFPGCHGRSDHLFGRETGEALAAAREMVRRFLGARLPEEIVFTRNATEALNLVATGYPWRAGDRVIVSDIEHNSNLLPWQAAARRHSLDLRIAPTRPDTTIDLDELARLLSGGAAVVAVGHVSNLSGVTQPVAEIADLARRRGARVVLDASQAVSHLPVRVEALGVDACAVSAHKMFGPAGIGCLYARLDLLERLEPLLLGGETVKDADYDSHLPAGLPWRFEAGVQNYPGAIGFGAAARFLLECDLAAVSAHLVGLNARLTDALRPRRRFRLVGPGDPARRGGVCTFGIDGLDPFDVVRLLDTSDNIMLRAGRHCAHAYCDRAGIGDTIRASAALYSTEQEIDLLADRLVRIADFF